MHWPSPHKDREEDPRTFPDLWLESWLCHGIGKTGKKICTGKSGVCNQDFRYGHAEPEMPVRHQINTKPRNAYLTSPFWYPTGMTMTRFSHDWVETKEQSKIEKFEGSQDLGWKHKSGVTGIHPMYRMDSTLDLLSDFKDHRSDGR